MSRSKILVTGATGTCGKQTVQRLLELGAEVRAGARSEEAGKKLAARGAEVVPFDFDRPETLRPAFAGVASAFLVTPFVDKPLPLVEAAVEAARAEDVSHLVRLSAAGADPRSEAALPRKHGLGELAVQRSGLGWTVLRPTFFMDNFVNLQARAIATTGRFYGASHGGRTAYISSRDIAGVAAAVLTEPKAQAGLTLELTGGEALSDAEVAERLGDVLRKAVEYVDLDPAQYAEGLRGQGTPEWMIEELVFLEGVKAAGWAASISPVVEELLGRPPETLTDFLVRNELFLT